ncbi:zinc ribbon domain-containing protein [Clostridium sp.]|uniref:zinc ribbon domain-containing protein n=1 Tax=Clostridium sp. TaxID=1506 RepID=UPI002616C68C|nr:zinc-ribbon domain-containing protein [uncultured Clostridium sp.]
MKFCTKCGKEVIEGTQFCTSCGNDLRIESTDQSKTESKVDLDTTKPDLDYDITSGTPETKSDHDINLVTNEPNDNISGHLILSKKSKIVMAVLAMLLVLLIATIKVGNSLSDPSKLVTRFQQDVETNNTSDLENILCSSDTRLIVDSKSISPLLSYFKSKPTYLTQVMQDLKDDSTNPKDISSLNTKSNNTLTLARNGKSFFIFPKYKINVKPSFIDITTTVKNVSFSINNTVIGKSETDNSTKEFGPYMPGTYSILANYKNKYVTLSKPYLVDLIETNGFANISIFDDMSYINITSDKPDANIFVNGKNVNVKVADASHFGPIDSSSKIYATCKVDGKTLTSDEYLATNDDKNAFLSFESASNTITNIHSQLDNLLYYYASSIAQAINNGTPSLIDTYVAYGSSLYNTQQSYIQKTYDAGIKETYNDSKIIDYNINDDNTSGTITSSESYTIVHADGSETPNTSSYIYGFKQDASTGYQLTSISKAK